MTAYLAVSLLRWCGAWERLTEPPADSPRRRQRTPYVLVAGHGAAAVFCDAVVRQPWGAWTPVVVKVGVAIESLIIGIPVIHEAAHLLVYRAALCGPWLGRGLTKTKRLKLFVAAGQPVPRGLLRVQLRFVPWAVIGVTMLMTALVCLISGAAVGRAVLLVSALSGCFMYWSCHGDLTSTVFSDFPDAVSFWDDGDGYRPCA